VKRKKVSLKDDTIVRVTGRASPYNINRLTLHTANGKVHGPFGERQHKESRVCSCIHFGDNWFWGSSSIRELPLEAIGIMKKEA
ncbi:Putative LOC101310879, partial [Caligus rogercresseyi]